MPRYKTEIEENLSKYQVLINDAKNAHNHLLLLLPVKEQKKHDVWFKAKRFSVHDLTESGSERTGFLTRANDEVIENVDDQGDTDKLDLPPFTNVGVDYFGPIEVMA